ncbi:MAG: 3-hydroxyacyl-CoA dehydrogenase family protein [Chloroflexota bacterium]|nr:3-hydroxyacyl-CoA dehydrogenase family protein [Chloroflexota bacterium]
MLAGYKVIVRDLNGEILAQMKDVIVNGRFGIKSGVERGKYTEQEMDQALANLDTTTDVEDLKDCDLIIEAVGGGVDGAIENKPLKLNVFSELDRIVKKEAVFVSNTLMFTIADLAQAVQRRDRFMGVHWFSPANIMKAVELTPTSETSQEVVSTLETLCERLGKTTVRVKDTPGDPGFIGNRVMRAARMEAQKIVDEGIATAEDVNTVMTLGFNWPAGPLPTGGPGARTGWR